MIKELLLAATIGAATITPSSASGVIETEGYAVKYNPGQMEGVAIYRGISTDGLYPVAAHGYPLGTHVRVINMITGEYLDAINVDVCNPLDSNHDGEGDCHNIYRRHIVVELSAKGADLLYGKNWSGKAVEAPAKVIAFDTLVVRSGVSHDRSEKIGRDNDDLRLPALSDSFLTAK